MAKYIALTNWTDQGIKNIKDSPGRVDSARDLATTLGCELQDFYLTIGAYDMVMTVEAPDDETVAKFSLALARNGNVRTTTLKALSEDAYREIIAAL